MSEPFALLMTDVVDSTRLNDELGDTVMVPLWAAHDRAARELVRRWRGREIGRSDGFLLLFERAADALGFALDYHRSLSALDVPLRARVGVHVGEVTLRENAHADQAQGATPFEVHGIALPLAARVMAAATGGQTLLSAAAVQALGPVPQPLQSHGFWRLKGVSEPVELFEIGAPGSSFVPPGDSAKAYRVVRVGEAWMPARELPHSLPAERDSFVGRRDALQALAHGFEDGTRLVTLLGIGGIGKTRLALRHARGWLGDYPGGAWFCDLSAARSVDGIVHAVAQGLEVPLGQGDPVQQLGAVIAARAACLVILDNFEQVARHAEETLGRWLEAAPQASFIATSREVLGIVGERALVLAPLAGDEAVQMFRQRVQAAGVDDRPSDQDEASVAALVDLLDRLPLAVELAAARARVMPPQMLLQRMGERFKLLASRGGRRDRQATLRATLDWSWDLLAPAEQSALAQLSVFEGGFTLAAAEAVVDLSDFADAPWAGDVVQTLLEKSLVRRLDSQRFDLLRSVHDYAGERLAASGSGASVPAAAQQGAWQRHWRFFAGLDEQQARADRCVEADNLVVACRRAALAGAGDAGSALLNAWAALCLTGPFATGVDLAQAVAATAPPTSRQRAAAERVLGHALHLLGDAERAREHCETGLALAQAIGESALQAQSMCLIANLELGRGRPAPAQQMLESALAVAQASADAAAQYLALNGLGRLHLGQSRLVEAQHCYRQALVLAEALRDRRWQGGLQGNLGHIAHAQGRLHEARDLFARGLALAREVGDRQWAGNAHCNLGLVLHELGDHVTARAELDAALALARAVGHRRLEATTLCNLGLVAEALSDDGAALSHHLQAAAAARALGDLPLEGQLRGYLGLALARLGRAGEAQQELQRAESLLGDCGDPLGLGLLLCQRALACALLGAVAAGRGHLERALARLEPLRLAPDSEASRTLEAARERLGV